MTIGVGTELGPAEAQNADGCATKTRCLVAYRPKRLH